MFVKAPPPPLLPGMTVPQLDLQTCNGSIAKLRERLYRRASGHGRILHDEDPEEVRMAFLRGPL